MHYDHIVIGAGSAGCAVAARLSEDGTRSVLLVEAGGSDRKLTVQAPIAFAKQFHSKGDWDYHTEPEPHLDGRRIHLPRGKVLGGCSSMNAMLWVRGTDADFDGWDVPGWNWEDCEPVFRRIEDHFLGGPEHGLGGPVHITRGKSPDPVTVKFVESARHFTKFPDAEDISGPQLEGCQLSPVSVDGGRRWNTSRAYLTPARRRNNLKVLTKATVRRVLIEDGRAVGIEYDRAGRRRTARAKSEVVLTAGAFSTPHLLQLSGIGPADHLREIGVAPIVDSPLVGANLQEHPMTFMNWELKPPHVGFADAANPRWLVQWLFRKTGKLASNFSEALLHVHTEPGLTEPDFQMVFAPGFVWENGDVTHPRPAMMLAQSYWTPHSRGTVLARSADPAVAPEIVTNMLSHAVEVEAMVRAIKLCREVMATGPIGEVAGVELHPGPGVRTDDEIVAWVRATAAHTFHPVGTAAMGTVPESVLDEHLRVRGVAGLRVADASVMPVIPRANTNAATVMIGERCADFVLANAERSASSVTNNVRVTGE